MSILSDFTAAAFAISGPVIGQESLTISGGDPVQGVANEANYSRDFETGGMEQMASLTFVVALSDFVAVYPASVKTYQGNKATARGESWRVGSISRGASFVTVSLTSTNKSA